MIESVESLDGSDRGNCTVDESRRNRRIGTFAHEQVVGESLGESTEEDENREGG